MTRALTERTSVSQLRSQSVSFAVLHEAMCTRCGGLMVNDFCADLLNGTGELECAPKRCVQCGEVVDPVILRNRRLRQDSMTDRLAGRICPNNCVTEGP